MGVFRASCGRIKSRKRNLRGAHFSLVKVAFRGADDGIRTHTSQLARTDFKSVASAISPHRLFASKMAIFPLEKVLLGISSL